MLVHKISLNGRGSGLWITLILLIGSAFSLGISPGLFVPGPASGFDLPAPPEGYAWVEFNDGRCAFLRPTGWFVKTQAEGDVSTLFISKENVEQLGRYRTGLSVSVIQHVKQQAGMSPSRFAERSVATSTASKEVLGQWSGPGKGGVWTYAFRYRDPAPSPTMLVHTLLLADDGADVLHVLVFGAPESEWERAWVHGEKMLQTMIVS